MVEPIYLFVIVQAFLLICYNVCYMAIENFQYTEMVFGSIFIIIVFGYFGQYLLTIPNIMNKSIYMASLFGIWYYFTKLFTNSLMKDKNGVIHWSV